MRLPRPQAPIRPRPRHVNYPNDPPPAAAKPVRKAGKRCLLFVCPARGHRAHLSQSETPSPLATSIEAGKHCCAARSAGVPSACTGPRPQPCVCGKHAPCGDCYVREHDLHMTHCRRLRPVVGRQRCAALRAWLAHNQDPSPGLTDCLPGNLHRGCRRRAALSPSTILRGALSARNPARSPQRCGLMATASKPAGGPLGLDTRLHTRAAGNVQLCSAAGVVNAWASIPQLVRGVTVMCAVARVTQGCVTRQVSGSGAVPSRAYGQVVGWSTGQAGGVRRVRAAGRPARGWGR